MGQIGDFMKWFDSAVEAAEKNRSVQIKQRVTGGQRPFTGFKRRSSRSRNYADQVRPLLVNCPGLSRAEICDRVGCSIKTVNFVAAELSGKTWATKVRAGFYRKGPPKGKRAGISKT